MIAASLAACGGSDVPVPVAAGDTPSFTRHIAPLFDEHCADCHGGFGAVEGGWDATAYRSVLESGESGPAVVIGDPAASLVVRVMAGDGAVMPPKGRLSEDAVGLVEDWIRSGAPEQ